MSQKRPPFTGSEKWDRVTWAALFVAIIGTAVVIVKAAASHDWLSILTTAFFLVVCLFVMLMLERRHRPSQPPETKVFRPFEDLDLQSVWRRPEDTRRIIEAIDKARDWLPLVVGESGAGKTTLLKLMVEEKLGDSVTYRFINEGYEGLEARLRAAIPDRSSRKRTVIALDQFEQWFAHLKRQPVDTRERERTWLRDTLRLVRDQSNCTVLLSIRSEWYYDLRFLGDLVPPPSETCEIKSPGVRNHSNEMREAMLASFLEVVKKRDTAEELLERIGADGRLSPLIAQLVGASIETQVKDSLSLESFDEELGGVDGAIDTYFKLILKSAARPTICMKILCALSLKTRFREQIAFHEIRAVLYERDVAIATAVEHLVEHRLVTEHPGNTYELTHDFLAEWFNIKSGAELSPIDRDNILAFVGAGGKRSDAVLTPVELKATKRIRWGRIAIGSLLPLMMVHLIIPGFDPSVGPEVAHPVIGPVLDSSYVLILAPYALWIVYVSFFYDRVLIFLKESPGAHLFSVFIVANLIVSTLVGIIFPVAWLLGITIGGLAFAAKLIWLSRRPTLNRSARIRLWQYGKSTLLNLIFVGVFGAASAVTSIAVGADNHLGIWLAFNLFASAVMIYWCLILTPYHVSRNGVSQLLALISRPGPLAHANADT